MENFKSDVSCDFYVANNETLSTRGAGNVEVELGDESIPCTIVDVNYAPQAAANILSVAKIAEKHHTLVFDNKGVQIFNTNEVEIHGTVKLVGAEINGVYKLSQRKSIDDRGCAALLGANQVSQERWHRRLGHLNIRSLSMLKRDPARGINFQRGKFEGCIACIKRKQTRSVFPKGQAKQAIRKLDLIHTDICGPMTETSWGGARYMLTFTDDFTRKTFCYLLKEKNETFSRFKIKI